MEISDNLKAFLEKSENQQLIDNNEWEKIYNIAENNLSVGDIGKLTSILLNVSINPLNYLDYIPVAYLAFTDIKIFNIPSHIEAIRASAFLDCVNLYSIYIPNKVSIIEEYAFMNCKKLKTIRLENSVKAIERYVFTNCDNLTSIIYSGTMEEFKNIYIDYRGNISLFQARVFCDNGSLYYNEEINQWVRVH